MECKKFMIFCFKNNIFISLFVKILIEVKNKKFIGILIVNDMR